MKPSIREISPLICNDHAPELQLICRAAFDAPVTAANEIMYMPAGVHDITPSQDGKPIKAKVLVTAEGAAALEQQRAALEAKGKRPYFDFNHEDGPASFWPTAFFWKGGEAPGIYARGEWTASGKAAIEGKEYRQFSPVFHVDNIRANPAKIAARAHAKPNMGGFVNDPAFQEILPFWAKNNADGAHSITTNKTISNMTPEELAALQAKNKQLESEIADLKGKETALKAKNETNALIASELKAKESELRAGTAEVENAALKAKTTEFEKVIKAGHATTAKAAVADAIARGAIAAKDSDTIAAWEKDITENPARAALLAKMAGNPALAPGRMAQPLVSVTGNNPAEIMRGLSAIQAKQSKVETIQGKHAIAREVQALYAKDIRGKAEVLDMPLEAAAEGDTLGTLAGTLVALRTLEDFEQALIPPAFITTDFSDVPAQFGQTTVSRIVVVPAVESYDPTLDANGYPKGWVVSTPATTVDAPVTLNRHHGVPIVFDSNVLASTVRRLFDEQANLAGYALAKDVNDALLAVITAANFPGTVELGNQPFVVAEADFGRGSFAKAGSIFNPIGVPTVGRMCLMNPAYFARLSQDPTLVSLAVFQKPAIIIDGELPPISKFQPLEAPNMPATGNLAAFFSHKSALVLQTRLPNDYTTILPGANNGNVSVIAGKTGLSMLLAQYVNHNGGYAAWRQAIMYGVAKGNAKGGWLVKSAA